MSQAAHTTPRIATVAIDHVTLPTVPSAVTLGRLVALSSSGAPFGECFHRASRRVDIGPRLLNYGCSNPDEELVIGPGHEVLGAAMI